MMQTILLISLIFTPLAALAYPELTRHGYSQCIACHVSPSGGGVLTSYGRQLSGEILSVWSSKGETGVLHGAVPDLSEKGWLIGGDVRSVQTHREDSRSKSGRYFLMQANLSLAVQKGPMTAMVSVGQIENPMVGYIQGNFNATQYYGMYQLTDTLSLRAGRFMPQFGLNSPDHTLKTKSGVGLRPGQQMDTVEAAWLGEQWTAFVAQAHSPHEVGDRNQESARTFHLAYAFLDRFKVGASHWYGEQAANVRRIYGVNAILGFTHRFFNLTEINHNYETGRRGMHGMTRFGYEPFQGFVPYVQYQHQVEDLNHPQANRHYALGANFFPRPHFEITGQWARVRQHTVSSWADEGYLLFHYYF